MATFQEHHPKAQGFGGGGFGGPLYYGPSPFDIFFYRPYYSYGYENDWDRRSGRSEPPQMGFLESVYSFVFGDGDPNTGSGGGAGLRDLEP